MASKNKINELVRRKIRELRKVKEMKIREIATRAGMPYSSYASMESGFYNIKLDNLFLILGALDVDIREVWPPETVASQVAEAKLYLQRIQQFRLGEIIFLSEAEGAALFVVKGQKCRILLYQGLSDFLLDRLIFYLEDGLSYQHGIWFRKNSSGKTFHFFLKGESCPDFLAKLIGKYLALWVEIYREG